MWDGRETTSLINAVECLKYCRKGLKRELSSQMYLYRNFTFSELYINDLIYGFFIERRLEKNLLFVAMHRSDSMKCYTVYQFIGTPEHKLHPFSLVNIFYSEKFVFDENNRQQAREKIEHFLFSQVHTF